MSIPSPQRLALRTVVGYGAGDAANNLAFSTATLFLLVYYTDVAHIPPAVAGTLLLVVRCVDAVTDVIAGRLVDRVSTRWGKFRPFLLWGALPLLLLSVVAFTIPPLGPLGVLAWAYVSYALLGLAYSMVNIPYGSLAAAMTQQPRERAKLSAARSVGAAVVAGGLVVFVTPQLARPAPELQVLFTSLTAAFVVVGCGFYLWAFLVTRERVARTIARVTLRQSLATLRGNVPLLLLCLSSFVYLVGMYSTSSAQAYYLRDVFHHAELAWIPAAAQLVSLVAFSLALPRMVMRVGKRRLYLIASAGIAAGGIVAFVAPNAAVALAGLAVGAAGVILVGMLVWALETDTVEYGEWRTGVRSEGITYALFSFTRKAGSALGGAVAAYALAVGGYQSGAAEQSDAAQWGIRAGAALVPVVCAVLAAGIIWFYPLSEQRHREIVAEIAARQAAIPTADWRAAD